jgi:hypothetical protein
MEMYDYDLRRVVDRLDLMADEDLRKVTSIKARNAYFFAGYDPMHRNVYLNGNRVKEELQRESRRVYY